MDSFILLVIGQYLFFVDESAIVGCCLLDQVMIDPPSQNTYSTIGLLIS
jgi:hypothetical protein